MLECPEPHVVPICTLQIYSAPKYDDHSSSPVGKISSIYQARTYILGRNAETPEFPPVPAGYCLPYRILCPVAPLELAGWSGPMWAVFPRELENHYFCFLAHPSSRILIAHCVHVYPNKEQNETYPDHSLRQVSTCCNWCQRKHQANI